MNKHSEIKNLITRLEKLQKSGWNYIYSLKNPGLTDGFWNKYGYKISDILDTLHSEEYINDFREYSKINENCKYLIGITVGDLFC
jgi:hypothetical protein